MSSAGVIYIWQAQNKFDLFEYHLNICDYFHIRCWIGSKKWKKGLDMDPDFLTPISNVTYPAGREATLTCNVKNLGKYKVIETFDIRLHINFPIVSSFPCSSPLHTLSIRALAFH